MPNRFYARSIHLGALLDSNLVDAVKQSRKIDLDIPDRFNLISLRAAILVDGGVLIHNQDAIEEGLALFRELHGLFPDAGITYTLADGLVAAIGQSA